MVMALQWFLLFFLCLIQPSAAETWCNVDTKNHCNSTDNQLSDLSCGWCRSWTFASNIIGNKLRLVGLDGGALPGDGNSTRDYMVEVSLDQPFNLTDGNNWKLSLLPKEIPKLKGSFLWPNPSNSTLFSYGGHSLATIPPTGNDFLTFDIKSNQWATRSSLVNAQRLTTGAFVNVPNIGKAFYMGGFRSNFTTSGAQTDGLHYYATEMIEFDMKTGMSSVKKAPFLPVQYGAASYIPAGNGSGALLYFGGEYPPSSVDENTEDFAVNSWDFVWIYDIDGNKWYRQPTFGSVDPRSEFCASTVFEPNSKSWQIWVIGGNNFTNKTVLNTVSILSVPSFEWFKAGSAETRMSMTCERVGSQIFVIGGMQGHEGIESIFNRGGKDYPAIAYIYDMNKQAPVSTYVPTSTSYAIPTSIREAILSARTPATWGDPAVQALFVPSSNTVPPRRVSGSVTAGIVIGVVLGMLITLGMTRVWFSRRRKINTKEMDKSSPSLPKPELDSKECEIKRTLTELDVTVREVVELDVKTNEPQLLVELDGNSTYHEMPGDEQKKTAS